tara:strand:- start:1163 stop:2368 length:1206 start_codon:yes stop_codon:yes gene_type:complete
MTQRKKQRPAFYGSNSNTAVESHTQRTNYSTYVDQISDPELGEVIDLWGKDRLYGKIDPNGTTLIPKGNKLKQLRYTKQSRTVFALNFVADAWKNLVLDLRDYAERGRIVLDSPYASPLATRGYEDSNLLYDEHIRELIYPSLSEEYLTLKQKNKQAKDFKGFLGAISPLLRQITKDFPLTRSGFIESNLCPVYCSGLVIDFADDRYSEDFPKLETYINDNNFVFFAELARRHGFYIDKNIPFRVVANVSSPSMRKYMAKYYEPDALFFDGVWFDHSYRQDIPNLEVYLFDMYEAFRLSNPYVFSYTQGEACKNHTISTSLRRAETSFDQQFGERGEFENRWYLKTYFLLRRLERNEELSEISSVADLRLIYDILETRGFFDALYYLHNHILESKLISRIK